MLRPMVSRLACVGVKHHLGPKTRLCFCFLMWGALWCGASSLTRRRVWSLQLLLALSSAGKLWRSTCIKLAVDGGKWSVLLSGRFTPGDHLVTIGYEAAWAPEPVTKLWRKEKSVAPTGNRTQIHRMSSYIWLYVPLTPWEIDVSSVFLPAPSRMSRSCGCLLFCIREVSASWLGSETGYYDWGPTFSFLSPPRKILG
jgi:hypothetical protein